jgi:N-methylhydantoinase A
MSWSVAVSTALPAHRRIPSATGGPAAPPSGTRLVYDAGLGAEVEALVYERDVLKAGTGIAGPAIVIEEGTSTLVSSSFELNVDGGGALVLTRKEAK